MGKSKRVGEPAGGGEGSLLGEGKVVCDAAAEAVHLCPAESL